MKDAVLLIFYTDSYSKVHAKEQGKFFYHGGKPVYLADMDEDKLMYKFNAYGIAKQILDAFSKVKIKPSIIYRIKKDANLLLATPTVFLQKGLLRNFGGHEQYFLPVQYFKAVNGNISDEPKNLPILNLNDWIKDVSNSSVLEPNSEQLSFTQIPMFNNVT